VIRSFRHRGLRRLFEADDRRGVRADQVSRIRRALALLDAAGKIEDVDQLPGMRLHRLKGELAAFWSISISGNWRITFRFENGEAKDVDLVDYH
jgi:proteic killer suppression protein